MIQTVALSKDSVFCDFLKFTEFIKTNLKTNRRWQELHENYSCWWNRKYTTWDGM